MTRVGVAAAALVVLAAVVVLLKPGGGSVRFIQPDRVQITFTGNGRTPALSPDGQRLAYSTRQCNADGYCTYDVVVQDVAGAGVSTVLRGWAMIWEIDWTSDGRYLLVNGFQGQTGNWGPFSVPSLGGGTARWLGCCAANLGAGDTALVARGLSGDSIGWILWVTMADGVVQDSLAVPRHAGAMTAASPLGGASRLLLVRREPGLQTALVTDRDGRVRDSLRLDDQRFTIGGPSQDGRAILVLRSGADRTGEYDMLSWAVGEDGRIAPRADTVLRQLSGYFHLARNGMLVTSSGPTDYEVWMMRRDGPSSMRFSQRRLTAGTALLGGGISLPGDRVVIWRRVMLSGKALTQNTVMPADSGAEVPLGPPLDYADWEWNDDGHSLTIAVNRDAGDSVDVRTQEIPSGRTRPLATFARRDFGNVFSVRGGGVIVSGSSGITLHLLGRPGRRDTTLSYPEAEGRLMSLASSPDGRDLVTLGWDRNEDSVVVRRVSLETGAVTRLWAFYADGSQTPHWLPDGTLLLPIRETGTTLVWYRMPAAGGRPVRLGTPPRATDATFRMSADGRRVIARVRSAKPDVYLIRNFAEMLRH